MELFSDKYFYKMKSHIVKKRCNAGEEMTPGIQLHTVFRINENKDLEVLKQKSIWCEK